MNTPLKILVTGGTGYIGSHIVVELLNNGHQVDIIDNLFNSHADTINKITTITNRTPSFHQIDLLDLPSLTTLFEKHRYDLVIHLAGLKAVSESTKQPLRYYHNNITGTINLLNLMQAHNVRNFIFSSSATVYGNPGTPKYTEALPTGQNISSPYGKTKYMIEEILKDVASSWPSFNVISLRYFNPISNHPSGLIGDSPNGIPNNLLPFIVKVAEGKLPYLSIYGNDYSTPDGTCLRDYIHVVDLAKGHLAAIQALSPGFKAYNLGSGKPASVLEILHAFEKTSNIHIPYEFASRRPGDLPCFYADPTLAQKELDWHTEHTIDDAMQDITAYLRHHQSNMI